VHTRNGMLLFLFGNPCHSLPCLVKFLLSFVCVMSLDCGNCSSPIENHHSSNLDGAEPITCIHLSKSYTTVDFCMDIGDKEVVDIHVHLYI